MSQRFLFIDGLNMARRYFHGMPDVTNAEGRPVGILIGWINAYTYLMSKYKPTASYVVFETGPSEYRRALYPEYKAHRTERPASFDLQLTQLYQLCEHLPLHVMSVDGFEADDVIATAATMVLEALPSAEVLLASSDKDFACLLVSNRMTILRPGAGSTKWEEWKAEQVQEKYGVTADRFQDYLTLIGDNSDGFKGVTSIGPKKASILVNQYGSLDLLAQAVADNQVRPASVQAALLAGWDTIERNQRLVEFLEVPNLPLHTEPEPGDYVGALNLLSSYGLNAQSAKLVEHKELLYPYLD